MNKTEDQEIFTTREVAELLKVDSETVREYIRSNRLKAFKLQGGGWRIKREDINFLLGNK